MTEIQSLRAEVAKLKQWAAKLQKEWDATYTTANTLWQAPAKWLTEDPKIPEYAGKVIAGLKVFIADTTAKFNTTAKMLNAAEAPSTK